MPASAVKNRQWCKNPCAPVENFLSLENSKPFEKDLAKLPVTILFPRTREIHASVAATYKDGTEYKRAQAYFSTGIPTIGFIASLRPRLKQTAIFIDRFFFGMRYRDIADKYGVQVGEVAKLYVNAKTRLVKTVQAMDRVELALSNGTPLVAFPNPVKVFLLHAVFGLSNGEICNLLDIPHNLVNRYITRTRDKLLAGEIQIIHCTDEDRQAARNRLKEARAARLAYDRGRQKRPRRNENVPD